MFANFFKKRRLQRYARVLTPELKKQFGEQTYYSREQVNAAIAKRKLNKEALNDNSYMYAMYCSPTDYQSFNLSDDYEHIRHEISQLCFGGEDFSVDTLTDYADSCSNDSGSDSSDNNSGGGD